MRVGDLVKYWFARECLVFGVVIEKCDYEINNVVEQGTYLYSVGILESDGVVEKFDIHERDEWEVISACG